MSILEDTKNARAETGERGDLRRQYRPIGIGAVAAALSAAGKLKTDNGNDRSSSRPEDDRYAGSIAA
jgi:hypothetical protein